MIFPVRWEIERRGGGSAIALTAGPSVDPAPAQWDRYDQGIQRCIHQSLRAPSRSDLRKEVGSFVSSKKCLSRKKVGFLNFERLAENQSKVAKR
jgi:hypothetical protein